MRQSKNTNPITIAVATFAIALWMGAPIAGAVPHCVQDLIAVQGEYAQMLEDFEAGKASLRDLVEIQQKLSNASECYASATEEIIEQSCAANLTEVQNRFAEVQADFEAGKATLLDLVEVQNELAAVSECYEVASQLVPGCTQQLITMQEEYAALCEAFAAGEADLRDLVDFQTKMGEAMECFEPSESKESIAGSPTAAVDEVSWSQIKASFR